MVMRTQPPPTAARDNTGLYIFWTLILLTCIGIGIAILILLSQAKSNIESATNIVSGCPPGEISLACTDYNPCTQDIAQVFCAPQYHDNNATCESQVCVHQPLADGSCCAADDVCYTPSDDKQCFNGQCVAANASSCLGYCPVDGDASGCDPSIFPFLPGVQYNLTCTLNSCTAIVGVDFPMNNPAVLFDQTNQSVRNLTGCMGIITNTAAELLIEVFGFQYGAFLWYNCAPFQFPDDKKRALTENEQATPALRNMLSFSYPGVVNAAQYHAVNTPVQRVLLSLYERVHPGGASARAA